MSWATGNQNEWQRARSTNGFGYLHSALISFLLWKKNIQYSAREALNTLHTEDIGPSPCSEWCSHKLQYKTVKESLNLEYAESEIWVEMPGCNYLLQISEKGNFETGFSHIRNEFSEFWITAQKAAKTSSFPSFWGGFIDLHAWTQRIYSIVVNLDLR